MMIATQVDDELAVHILDYGSGTTILFLHGFNGGCGLERFSNSASGQTSRVRERF